MPPGQFPNPTKALKPAADKCIDLAMLLSMVKKSRVALKKQRPKMGQKTKGQERKDINCLVWFARIGCCCFLFCMLCLGISKEKNGRNQRISGRKWWPPNASGKDGMINCIYKSLVIRGAMYIYIYQLQLLLFTQF